MTHDVDAVADAAVLEAAFLGLGVAIRAIQSNGIRNSETVQETVVQLLQECIRLVKTVMLRLVSKSWVDDSWHRLWHRVY